MKKIPYFIVKDDNKRIKKFIRERVKNNPSDKKEYYFEYIEEKWKKDSRVRRFIVKATNYKNNSIVVGILCANLTIPADEAIWLMFKRWIQENNFKYLYKHFGLNQLTSYKYNNFRRIHSQYTDKNELSKEYKEAKKILSDLEIEMAKKIIELQRIEKKITKLEDEITLALIKIDKIENDEYIGKNSDIDIKALKKQLSSNQTKRRNAIKKSQKISEEIKLLTNKIETAEEQFHNTLKYNSKIDRLIRENYQFLDLKEKTIFDALKITAANSFFILPESAATNKNCDLKVEAEIGIV